MLPGPVVPYIREADFAIRKPWYTPPRRLLDYLLLYVQAGECLVEVEGEELLLTDGDTCLIQPDTLHSLRGRTDTITPYLHLDLFFNPRREEGFPTRGGQVSLSSHSHLVQPRLYDLDWLDVPVRLQPTHPVQFHSTLLKAVEAWQNGDALSRLEANHLAMTLILAMFRQYGRTPAVSARQSHSLSWVSSYLSFHIGEPLSVADMARRANLSPSRFSVVFREHFGLSPHQYFLRLRIEHAQSLLTTTDLPLRDIADSCGFADVHHFSKSFKRLVHVTPGAYRQSG
ncbi:MAG: helix-turn-helix domain-containing protein [Thermomicrobiales bacterium]